MPFWLCRHTFYSEDITRYKIIGNFRCSITNGFYAKLTPSEYSFYDWRMS